MAQNPMIGVLRPCEDSGRDESDASPSQGLPGITQMPEEERKDSFPEPSEVGPADTLISVC